MLTATLLALALLGCDGVDVGREAPDFTLPNLDGKAVTLTGKRGNVVLLSFVATWAAPCRISFPALSGLQQKYGKQGLVVIAVTVGQEAREAAKYFQREPVLFTVLSGDEVVVKTWFGEKDMILPLTFLIDERGRVRAKFTGYHAGEDIAPEIEKVLAEK
jgi:peroxiredoxin